jgi:hypothetical protein
MIRWFVVGLVMFFALTAGVCEMEPMSEPVEYSEIIGTYEANYDAGLEDRLELSPDSTYIRYFVTREGREFTDTGRYIFSYDSDDHRRMSIMLFNFRLRFPVDPTHLFEYNDAEGAVVDSLPCTIATSFHKAKRQKLRIGMSEYGQAYIKQD